MDREGVIDVLAQQSGEKREIIANDMVPAGLNPDGYLNVEDIAADLKWFEDEGLLPHPIPIDRVVDHSYVAEAIAELGPYQAQKRRTNSQLAC